MSVTVGIAIQRVQSLYSKGVQSDDSRLAPRHIFNKLETGRNTLISRKAKKKQAISQNNYTVLTCVPLELVPSHECPCLPPVGCKVLRTKEKIPTLLSDYTGDLILSVTSIEHSVSFSMTTLEGARHKKGSKFTKDKPDYYRHNGYLYITHKTAPKFIEVTALFEHLEDALNFGGQCDEDEVNCTSMLDHVFPIDSDLIEPLIKMCVEELIQVFNQSIENTTNDTMDAHPQQSK